MKTTQTTDMPLARDKQVTWRNYSRLGYVRWTRGVYGRDVDTAHLDQWSVERARFLRRVRAIMRLYHDRDIALYGVTALQVLGVALPSELEDWQTCHVVVPSGAYRPKRHDVVAHRSDHALTMWDTRDGLPVAHPVEHWLQVAGASDEAMIEIGDGFVRRQRPLLTMTELTSRLSKMSWAHGVRQARRVLPFVMADTDSIYETRTRLALTGAGLPCPSVNHPVRCRSVGRTYHADMAYPAERIAIEYDGLVHVNDRRQMEIDVARRQAFQEAGWLVMTATSDQLSHPTSFVRSVEAALALRRGANGQKLSARAAQ